jgi:superfamily II DNA/RNA helicase
MLARGIDVRTVGLVINIEPPRIFGQGTFDFKTYQHRIGRTGRHNDYGVALTFLDLPRKKDMIPDNEFIEALKN